MSIGKISIRQIKAARALLGWSQDKLAESSGVSLPTIARLEALDAETIGGRASTADAIRSALEKAGVVFISADAGGPGVRLPIGVLCDTPHP
ncbi:helix-turn-helix domain-containing protein [Leisingera sp. F5]|uniref:helix-turn-helix domain-containing protein n=1 Tax=Leisingera sp. F5 TaxID=1813816 RepID=UPI0025B90B91|nr:helix-turn-helix domain-containing protein [Leisingera sp. F5]